MSQLQQEELRPFLAEAINPETPPHRLKMLAAHQAWLVRSLVAKNPSTPSRSIEMLVHDENQLVREAAYWGRR
jgi:hypothetical protein